MRVIECAPDRSVEILAAHNERGVRVPLFASAVVLSEMLENESGMESEDDAGAIFAPRRQ